MSSQETFAAFDGLEQANREMARQIEQSAPRCHFKPMNLEQSDSTDGQYDEWWECSFCGHTKDYKEIREVKHD